MNILVAYESRKGHTRQAAEAIATAAREQGGEVIVRPIKELQAADVEQADVLFVGTWLRGFILFGVRPVAAKRIVAALPSLADKPAGIFCTYAVNPRGALRKLRTLLESRGADVQAERAFQRDRPGEAVGPFVRTVVEAAGTMSR
jgi:menaquinone-dependent protoporphyrinogen IX oxidase